MVPIGRNEESYGRPTEYREAINRTPTERLRDSDGILSLFRWVTLFLHMNGSGTTIGCPHGSAVWIMGPWDRPNSMPRNSHCSPHQQIGE